jgi:hypothetical protein
MRIQKGYGGSELLQIYHGIIPERKRCQGLDSRIFMEAGEAVFV